MLNCGIGSSSLKCRGEGVRQAPDRPRLKLFVFRIEIEVVHQTGKMYGSVQVAFNERPIDDQLGGRGRQLLIAPLFHLAPHRFEVALHAVHADSQAVLQREVLRVLGQDRGERAWDNVSEFWMP